MLAILLATEPRPATQTRVPHRRDSFTIAKVTSARPVRRSAGAAATTDPPVAHYPQYPDPLGSPEIATRNLEHRLPVFTKLLHISPADARLFSFAVQTVGMGAASLSILYQKSLSKPACSPGPVAAASSAGCSARLCSSPSSLRRWGASPSRRWSPAWLSFCSSPAIRPEPCGITACLSSPSRKAILCAAACLGGILSGLIGCGENIVVFMVMVVLFRVNEKVVTPTTVLLMSIVTSGSVAHSLVEPRTRVPHLRDSLIVAKVGSALPKAGVQAQPQRPTCFPPHSHPCPPPHPARHRAHPGPQATRHPTMAQIQSRVLTLATQEGTGRNPAVSPGPEGTTLSAYLTLIE